MEGGKEETRERREGGVGKEGGVVSMQELVQSATVTTCRETSLPSTHPSSHTLYICENTYIVS